MLRFVFGLCFMLINLDGVLAQNGQTVRGKISDAETRSPLPGATVLLLSDTTGKFGTTSDDQGMFMLENVPLGKQSLRFTFVGYEDKVIDITVNSAKENVLDITMEESSIMMQAVEILGTERGQLNNDMALVSSKSFDVAETERYAGSRGDPARMASNYAGVQGADDSRNDIVVRGNSPLGVLYKMEGFDLPNPNHFAIAGSAGGPVSILNNKVLANSDFFTSAFPAEYGNSSSAVFDLKMRPGNNSQHEFTGQFGFLGTEIAAEGPLNKSKGSSYLLAYRYSTLTLMKFMGISLGTDAVPKYQDLSFKFNFPLKSGGVISCFGIGGNSNIDIMISEQKEPKADLYAEDDRDQHFGTRMGTTGITFTKTLREKTFLRTGIALAHEQSWAKHDFIIRHIDSLANEYVLDSMYTLMQYTFNTNRVMYMISFNTKLNKKHVLKYGANLNGLFFNLKDSALNYAHNDWLNRWNYEGSGMLAQAYVQWKWKANEKWQMTAGLFAQYFSVSKSLSPAEPRLGIKYNISEKQSLHFGSGLHSQTQPYYTYFYAFDNADKGVAPHNRSIDLTKSLHNVLGYEACLSPTLKFKAEVYYQYLYNIPVEKNPSSFSLTNMGSGFVRFFPDTLENTGTGRNMGLEITLEKYFNKTFYFLFSASVFDAKYRGSDDTLRNTDYNGKYAANFLLGKEFKAGEKGTLGFGTKITTAGGRWYGDIDSATSAYRRELVFYSNNYNSHQFRPYFRLDLKISYKLNAKKVTHEFALDLVNVLGTKNILNLTFNANNNGNDPDGAPRYSNYNYQLGFLPLFYYRIDF